MYALLKQISYYFLWCGLDLDLDMGLDLGMGLGTPRGGDDSTGLFSLEGLGIP